MRWKSVSVTTAALLLGAGLAACRPVAPPPPPPHLPTLPALTPASWTSPALDGTIQAQPLFVPNASLPGGSTPFPNGGVVVVATEHDAVYGLDPMTGAILWGPTRLGTAEPLSENDAYGPLQTLPGCGDLDPIGITSNPVLDNADVWVVGERELNPVAAAPHQPQHVIAGINPATGGFQLNPTAIDAPAMTVATPGSTQNEVSAQQQRAGLEAVNGQVYIGFGGLAGDCGPYHGFVLDVRESDGTVVGSFESSTSPGVTNDREGAVWAPAGLGVSTADGTLYAATGNSQDLSTPPANEDYSQAVDQLHMPFSGATTPTNVFQPSTFVADNASDLDISSTAPLLVNGGTQVFQIGKRGTGYLLNESNLGLVAQLSICSQGSYGATATLGTSIFVPCRGSVMQQLVLTGGSMTTGWTSPSNVTAGGPAVVDPSTDLVFSADTGSNQLFGVSTSTGLASTR